MRPSSSLLPRLGSMALVKIVANSIPIRPMAKNSMVVMTLNDPGAAHQRPNAPTKYITENSQMNGIRCPALSAIAPRIGAAKAIISPAAPIP